MSGSSDNTSANNPTNDSICVKKQVDCPDLQADRDQNQRWSSAVQNRKSRFSRFLRSCVYGHFAENHNCSNQCTEKSTLFGSLRVRQIFMVLIWLLFMGTLIFFQSPNRQMTPFCDALNQSRILVGSWVLMDQQIQKTKSPEIVNFLCSTAGIIRAKLFRVWANVTLRQLRQLFRCKKVDIFYNRRHQKRCIFAGQEMVQKEWFSRCTN